MKNIAIFYLGCLTILTSCSKEQANTNVQSGPYSPDWSSLSLYNEEPEWFKDAKFGIYLHWGVLSVPAFANDWYPRNMHIPGTREFQHHVETYGAHSDFGYHDYIPMFKAESFDADEWAGLFKKSGARFAGMVAEHHDGFAMWASAVNPWNAKDMGPKRDLLGELEDAVHSHDMKFVTTFHVGRNFQKYAEQPEAQTDSSYFPYSKDLPTSATDSKLRQLYGNIPAEQFQQNWLAQLFEVIDNYRPDLIYFDGWVGNITEESKIAFVTHYLNSAHEWGKEVVITHKGDDLPREVSISDFEKGRMNELTDFTWLTDETISTGSWSYVEGLQLKTPNEILHVLIDIVSKNGVMMLNISPRADGVIPEDQQAILLRLGDWLGKYGEAIYETRPWLVYGEGPTKMETGGHFVGRLEYTPSDIRYTTKDSVIYVLALGWPGAGKILTLSSFQDDSLRNMFNIKDISMLGTDEDIRWRWDLGGLNVIAPQDTVDDMAVVFKVITERRMAADSLQRTEKIIKG